MRRFRRGELPISSENDTSALRGDVSAKHGVVHMGDVQLEGDLAAYGWKPAWGVLGASGMALFCAGIPALVGFFFGGAPWSWFYFGGTATPLGIVFFIWYPFIAAFPRLVIFDRRRRLVHIPRWFSRRPDAVRWQDAQFLILDEPTGYLSMYRATALFALRPGWSIETDGYPAWRYRQEFYRSANDDSPSGDVEACWRFIVSFMTDPPEECEPAVEVVKRSKSVVDLRYGGTDWAAYRQSFSGGGRMWKRLYGTELLTEPNWIRDADGAWHELPEGPRERVVLPDGPTDKRVPVVEGE
jgi:hypothetical protein